MARRVLLTIYAGPTYRFSTHDVAVSSRVERQSVFAYVGGLICGDALPTQGLGAESTFDFTLPTDVFDARSARQNGINIAGADAEVAFLEEGGMWEDRDILLLGQIPPPSEHRDVAQTSWTVDGAEVRFDQPFPPYSCTTSDFATLPASEANKRYSVVYGEVVDLPLMPLGDINAISGTVKLAICASRIASLVITVRPDGVSETHERAFQATVATMALPSGATLSYVEVATSLLAGSSTFIATVRGHVDDRGALIQGLGDVVMHLVRQYAQVPEEKIDHARMSRFIWRANSIAITAAFGGTDSGGAIQSAQSRFGQVMPIDLSWRNGRIGADWLMYNNDGPIRNLTYGEELTDRIGAVQVGGERVLYSNYTVEYRWDATNEKMRRRVNRKAENSAAARRARDRFSLPGSEKGLAYQTLQVADVASEQAAFIIADSLIDRYSINRAAVTYRADYNLFSPDLPLTDTFFITDSDWGWDREPFRLDSIKPLVDGLCEVSFSSFRDASQI